MDLCIPALSFNMSTPITPQKPTVEDALRTANTRFYSAFESLDIAQMEAVWAHDDEVECVHPGWELLLGWEEVRERWARLFANARRVRIALSSVWIRIEGRVGWVACTEHVTTAFADSFDDAMVQATNIFVLQEEGWMLVAHHASPLPNPAHSTVQ